MRTISFSKGYVRKFRTGCHPTASPHTAQPRRIPILAIEAFSGVRVAELPRVDWSAVDLDRKIIELRADQAKTAARRVTPITANFAAWLAPMKANGKAFGHPEHLREIM